MNATRIALTISLFLSLVRPHEAFAIPTQLVYKVLSADGPILANAGNLGILLFDLDESTPTACRYYMEWNDYAGIHALSAGCYVNEAKPHGAATCSVNAQIGITSLVVNDRTLPCDGFASNQPSPVFLLVAGEASLTGALTGLIQFTAANTHLYGFEGLPKVP